MAQIFNVSPYYGPNSKQTSWFEIPEKEAAIYSRCENSGYVPRADQIKAFQESGVLLRTQRALQYDYDGLAENPEEFTKFFNKLTTATDLVDLSELEKRGKAAALANEVIEQQKARVKKEALDERMKKYEEELSAIKARYKMNDDLNDDKK